MSNQGTYRLIRKIADGGMAEIFLAEALGAQGFRRPVVLKRVRQALFADPQFRNMLIDEAHIAMGLNHGNVVPVLGIGESEGRYFLAMELVDGWSLDEVIRRSNRLGVEIPRALSLYVVAQTCRALAYAHAFSRDGKPLQIVHRDVSPQNILLSEQGEVKLADFGIARALTKSEQTAPGIVKGKVRFMSPEQTQGVALDRRSDLFALGTVLYQLVVGRLPFDGPNDLETMTAISAARFMAPKDAQPALEAEVAQIIEKAMKRLPSDRYADADQMLADVERVLRAVFPPTGQTELKAWLSHLAQLDGALPISKVPVSAIDKAEVEGSAAIELHDSDILPPSRPPAKSDGMPATRGPAVPTPIEAPRRGRLWAPLFLLAALAAVAWHFDALNRLPSLFGVPPESKRAPTLDEVLPPIAQPQPPQEPPVDEGWQDFPVADAGVLEAEAPPPSVVAEAAAESDGGAAVEEVEEAQLLSEVEPDAGTIEQDEGEAEVVDAGLARAAEPALAPTVMVKIGSVPPGAVVKLKRRVFGQTPISLRFRSGIVFELEFFKSGYAPATKRFLVTDKPGQQVWVPLKKAQKKRGK